MKIFLKAILILLLSTVVSPLYAAELASEGTPARKLQRGFVNLVLSPYELSAELAKEKKNDSAPPSWVMGIGRGFLYSVGRSLVGVGEMVTFFIPAPANYGPILQPEMPWDLAPKLEEDKKAA